MAYVKWLIEFKETPDSQVGYIKDVDAGVGELSLTRDAAEAIKFDEESSALSIIENPVFQNVWAHLMSRISVHDHMFDCGIMPLNNSGQ